MRELKGRSQKRWDEKLLHSAGIGNSSNSLQIEDKENKDILFLTVCVT